MNRTLRYQLSAELVPPRPRLVVLPDAVEQQAPFGGPSIRSHVLVRNPDVEARLEELAASRPLIRVRAPLGSGKRTAVASWLQHSPVRRETTWIDASADAADSPFALSLVFDALERIAGKPAPAPSSSLFDGFAERRARAVRFARALDRRALIVLDVADREPGPRETAELSAFIRDSVQVQILVIQDDDTRPAVGHAMSSSDIDAQDLRLTAPRLRDEAARRGLQLPETTIQSLVDDDRGSPAIAAAFFADLEANAQRQPHESLAQARAAVLVTTMQRLMPDSALDLATLLTVVPAIGEEHLVQLGIGAPSDPARLRSLRDRGLIESVPAERGVTYRLPASTVEAVRAMTVPHYLQNRGRLHRIACELFLAVGDLEPAIRQLLLLQDVAGALGLLCAHWDDHLRLSGAKRARALTALFSMSDVLQDLEASSAVWLIHATPPESALVGPYVSRVLASKDSEIGNLSVRGRLTVRTAYATMLLERGRIAQAEAVVADALSDLERVGGRQRVALGHVFAEFLLVSARTALSAGSLRRAAQDYDEALAFSTQSESPVLSYRALAGRALILAFNGEFDACLQLIARADGIAAEHGLALSRAAVELAWAQGLVRIYTEDYEGVRSIAQLAKGRISHDPEWQLLGDYLEARILMRSGFRLEAASVVRGLLSSTQSHRGLPLLRQELACFLGLALIMSNQPGAAVDAVTWEPPNEDHAPCPVFVRAFALIAQGDPDAAIEATDACVARGHEHANLPLMYVYLARALAFEVLGLDISAEDAFLTSLGLAQNAGIHVKLEKLAGQQFTRLLERSRTRAPMLAGFAVAESDAESEADLSGALRGMTRLTLKEREILQHLIGGGTLASIGAQLFVSENTVKTHTKNIYRKLGVTSRREAADLAAGWGLRPPRHGE